MTLKADLLDYGRQRIDQQLAAVPTGETILRDLVQFTATPTGVDPVFWGMVDRVRTSAGVPKDPPSAGGLARDIATYLRGIETADQLIEATVLLAGIQEAAKRLRGEPETTEAAPVQDVPAETPAPTEPATQPETTAENEVKDGNPG